MKELYTLLQQYRIAYPMTQKQLADKAGVSVRTIQLFENGTDIRVSTLMKLLEALGLSENVALLIPDVTKRPSYEMRRQREKLPRRVRVRKKQEKTPSFQWGDEKC